MHSSDTSRYQERQQLLDNFLYYVEIDFYHRDSCYVEIHVDACKSVMSALQLKFPA